MILFTMYDSYNGYYGNGRKNAEKYIYTKNKEKIPRLVSLPSPRL